MAVLPGVIQKVYDLPNNYGLILQDSLRSLWLHAPEQLEVTGCQLS